MEEDARSSEQAQAGPGSAGQAGSSSPRRPRLMSSKDRTHSAASGSRSPRPRNAITDSYESQTFAYAPDDNHASHQRSNSHNSVPPPRRSESDRGPYIAHAHDEGTSDSISGQSHINESDFPSLSAVSNFPSLSGIGLATQPLSSSFPKAPSLGAGIYSSSPPVPHTHSIGSGNSSHYARVGAGAATSSTTTTSAAGHRSRSRLPSRNSEVGSGDFTRSGSGSQSSRRRQSSQERPRTGISSGTSNSNSSTWSFFRSSSSAQLAPRAQMPDSFATISEKAEPMLSPVFGRSGVSTPLGYDAGAVTPLVQPSGLNEELRKRIAGLRNESRSRSKTRVNYSCNFVLSEGSHSQSGSAGGSFMSAKRRGRRGSASGFGQMDNQPKRRAEGLVAMAAKETNTSESSKVVVAGRTLLKILSVSRPHSNSDSGEESHGGGSGWSADYSATSSCGNGQTQRSCVQVEEEMDLHSGMVYGGPKNSKAALINDVGWGYDYTADKIMTGNSNGVVALYDLGKGGSKLERLKTHHPSGRAVNVVSFAGPSGQGTLLASGCQDGDIKLSDVRHASIITLATPLDPIRAMCFAPRHNSTADPFQLLSAYESGNIARWDLRMPKNPVERLMAHHGGVLSIDWKGSTGNTQIPGDANDEARAASSYGWGWLATAGIDGTVKIWDMSTPSHTPQAVHTLHIGRASHFVRWATDPMKPCDIIIAPTPIGSSVGTLDDSWQPDVEIWDVRREHLPKQTFWLGGSPVSAFNPTNNPDVLWCLNRKTSAFQQVDINREAILPIEYVPKVAAAWSADGSFAFAIGTGHLLPAQPVQSTPPQPVPSDRASAAPQATAYITGLDPTFDVQAFRFLADHYRFIKDDNETFTDLCQNNAEAAIEVNRYDTAKIWRLIGQWLEDSTEPDLPTPGVTETRNENPGQADVHKSPAITRARAKSRTSPSNPFQQFHLHEGHTSRQSSPLVTSHVISEADVPGKPAPLSLPLPRLQQDNNNADLVGSDTSAGSSVEESLSAQQVLNGSSSEETDLDGSGRLTTRPSEENMFDIQAGLAMPLPSHIAMKRRPTLSTISQQPSGASSRTITRSSSSANNAMPAGEASAPQTRKLASEDPTAGTPGSGTKPISNDRAEQSRDGVGGTSRWVRKEPLESSASEASDTSDVGEEQRDHTVEELRARRMRRLKAHDHKVRASQGRSKSRRRGATSADEVPERTPSGRQSRSASGTRRGDRSNSNLRSETLAVKVEQAQNQAKDLLIGRFEEHLQDIMQRLADDGDVQTSATIACAVRHKIDVKPQFMARITTAYLSLLRSLDCHLTSAKVSKDSTVASIKSQSQDNTTIRTACGNCHKAIHHSPFGKCQKCSAETTTCCICHTIGLSLWVFCPTCGHGVHEDCLYAYASDVSRSALPSIYAEKVGSALPTPTTVPSSPHVALDSPSSTHWLFPSEQALFTPVSALPSRLNSRAASPDLPHLDQNALESRAILLSQCPSGCGHSCLLALPLSELPAPSWVY